MKQNQTVFILDAGNTSLKLGVFQDDSFFKMVRFDYSDLSNLENLYKEYNKPTVFISSVLTNEKTILLSSNFESVQVFDRVNFNLPIEINYKSSTLGVDRICNAIAANNMVKHKNVVIIDVGTCIKFDFVNELGVYQGGSISPGINLRYKSLNDYTGNLPLIKKTNPISIIGNSTNDSIHSGVINGIKSEIQGFISQYEALFDDLTFFMTGGDAKYFDFPLKNNIFVDENLTLKGLYIIHKLNAK